MAYGGAVGYDRLRPISTIVVRYRFSEFTLCPQRRLLVREGREVPLIPRYFDLLLLLVEHRREAVHRREIFDRVWADSIVSESALSQAIRTIRRTLGDDDPREPRFIRTVSRHGYQFVFPDVIEEEDDLAARPAGLSGPDVASTYAGPADAAMADTPTADTPTAAPFAFEPPPMPLEGIGSHAPPDATAADETPGLRVRRAARLASSRLTAVAVGCALAGVWGGGVGGLILAAAPGSFAPIAIAPVLAVIGGGCGAIGGAGVGLGLAFAEAFVRSQRMRILALTISGAMGGGLVGVAVQWLTRWALASLVGLHLDVGGGLEGVLIGGGAGLGFAIATRRTHDGFAAPRGGKRWRAALVTAVACGLAGLALMLTGRPLAGGTIHVIADAADGSRATLAPLGRLVGEPDFGPVSSAILGFGEAATFGFGLAYGLMRRPRGPS